MDLVTIIYHLPDLIASDMEGDTVMMRIESGEYFGLGGAGSRIWELLEFPLYVQDVIDTLCTEFEVDEAACQADVLTFAEALLQNQLIAVVA